MPKTQRKGIKRNMQKISKIFWRRKTKKQRKPRARYQNLHEKEKEKKRQYHRERNKNLPEELKQNQVEHMRNYYLAHKK